MTESERTASAPQVPQPKRKGTKSAKPAKKAARANKRVGKPAAERSNKKAEVLTLMKRAKGATLAEIMGVTKWQAHTVRGCLRTVQTFCRRPKLLDLAIVACSAGAQEFADCRRALR